MCLLTAQGAFYLLGFGLVLGTLVFIVELVQHKVVLFLQTRVTSLTA